jgi:hypothetical protein
MHNSKYMFNFYNALHHASSPIHAELQTATRITTRLSNEGRLHVLRIIHLALLLQALIIPTQPTWSTSYQYTFLPTDGGMLQLSRLQSILICTVQTNFYVGFEVLTAMVMKSSLLHDITPYGPFTVNRHFGGTCHLHLQGRGISQAISTCFHAGFFLGLFVGPEGGFQRTTQHYIPEDRTLQTSF